MALHESVKGVEMAELFARADHGDRQAAVLLDMRVYMITIDMAVEHGWRYEPSKAGRELFRHVSRLALSRHVDPSLWACCRSCGGDQPVLPSCTACGGTGSLLIDPARFEDVAGGRDAGTVWAARVNLVSDKISGWASGRSAA